jgi:hypothetical protein
MLSPMTHSENVSPTLKLETTEISPLLNAESGCSRLNEEKLLNM